MRVHIKGARLIDPGTGFDEVSDLWVAGGRITAIGATT